jgi:hypothetical protein
MDPAPLLDERASGDHLPVPIKRKLSERIEEIGKDHPLANAAERLRDIVAASTDLESDITVYNWGDVQDEESLLCDLGNRNYQLNAQDIQHYLSLSSVNHKVRMIFRGHEHKFQHLMHQDRVLVTTLPVGADSTYLYGPDRAYIITPQTEVGKWRKRAIMRKKGGAACSLSETSELITSRAL